MLDQQGCLDITGTNYYSGAIFTPGSALVNPLSLARGLAANLPANVLLRDDTAVLGMTSVDKGYELTLETTDKQTYSTTASKVILAVDPFTPEFGYLKNRILPLLTFASITRPLTDSEKARFKGTLDWGLTPADAGGTTLRMTQDGRILLRNQYANAPKYRADKHMLADVEEKQREGFEKRYPDLSHVPFETTWGGVCGLSANHVSHFGEVAKGVYSASCYNGVGVAKGTISGKLLAEMACDHATSELEDIQTISGLPSLIPPEPIRGIGVTTRLKFAEWQSKDEI
jgi:glycine/D-amino acid oxidase-like deaminating enzyme